MTNPSDIEYIEGFKAGDFASISQFYTLLLKKARATLRIDFLSAAEFEDLIQDAVISVYTNIQNGKYTYDPTIKLTSYALKICQYQLNNVVRKKGRGNLPLNELSNASNDDLSPHEHIELIERNKVVSDSINRLGENCRRILRLYYWEKQSIQEIATVLNMQSNSVKNGKYRCMQKLSQLLYEQKEAGRL